MSAEVYVFHSGQPGIPQLSAAGGAGQLEALLYAVGVTGFGGVTLDSLTQSGGEATATRAAGLNLADGITGMPHIVEIANSTNGWNGEYALNAAPGATNCIFNCPPDLPSPATGTITLKRAPAGMTRTASASNKSVWQFKDTATWPGYLMLDDSNAGYAGMRLAETAAGTPDYSTMTGLCPTVAQWAAPGLYWRKTDGAGGNKPFVIVIWRGGMYMGVAWSNSYPTLYDTNYAGCCLTNKAGDAFHGIITGSTSLPAQPGTSCGFSLKNPGASQLGQYIQRTHNQGGSALQFTRCGNYYGGGILGGSIQNASYAPPDSNPSDGTNNVRGPLDLIEGTTIAGNLRGQFPLLWDPVNCGSRATFDMLTNMPNLPGRTIMLVKIGAGSSSAAMIGVDITTYGTVGF